MGVGSTYPIAFTPSTTGCDKPSLLNGITGKLRFPSAKERGMDVRVIWIACFEQKRTKGAKVGMASFGNFRCENLCFIGGPLLVANLRFEIAICDGPKRGNGFVW